MKASELRIGNFYNQFGNITEVDWSILKELKDAPIDQLWCKPIPLTEEWLLKFGFEKGVDDLVLDINTMLFVSYNDDEFVHLKSNHLETITSIKYVHQLQNLYFALTGEELTIKN